MTRVLWPLQLCWVLVVGLAVGCQPEIGDSCDVSLDCSTLGNRLCDRTQPGGYCTVPDCEEGACPDDSVCVRFWPNEPRLSATYCMASCSRNSDCRKGSGYRCMTGDEFGRDDDEDGKQALVLEGEDKRFCAQPALQYGTEESEAESTADADGEETDAAVSTEDSTDADEEAESSEADADATDP